MDFITLLLIAIGLTFDTFAVSISTGLVANNIRFWQATKVATVLAFFQALMPLIGWFIGSQLKLLIAEYDHWVAFGLLTAIGLKMILESFKKEENSKNFDPFKPMVLVGMAIATSIDALIVGVSFALIDVNIVLSVGIIGFATYVVAMLGMLFGKNAGKWFGKKMEILGGLILIGIGIKILMEHLVQ
jgi:manganese efflux pump family protein